MQWERIPAPNGFWITLAIGAVGFGGLFSIYTYLADTLTAVTQVSPATVPLVLSAFGVGLTVGNMVVPIFADRAVMRTAGLLLVWSAVVLALFPLMAHNVWLITLNDEGLCEHFEEWPFAPDQDDGHGDDA